MEDVYKTIAAPAEGLYKEKGSRFIAFACPVSTEEEIGRLLAGLKREYHDARHHCYAWRLGVGGNLFRANDDGEPSYSAGKPILGQIRSYDLTDILIVVVRYFGGIKLGVPGLVNAYRQAAADALLKAEVVEKTVAATLRVRFGYPVMDEVMRAVRETAAEVQERRFGLGCEWLLSVRLRDLPVLRARLEQIASLAFVP